MMKKILRRSKNKKTAPTQAMSNNDSTRQVLKSTYSISHSFLSISIYIFPGILLVLVLQLVSQNNLTDDNLVKSRSSIVADSDETSAILSTEASSTSATPTTTKPKTLLELKSFISTQYSCNKTCPYTGTIPPTFESRQILGPLQKSFSKHKKWGSNNHNGNYLAELKVFRNHSTMATEEEEQLLKEGLEYVDKFWVDFEKKESERDEEVKKSCISYGDLVEVFGLGFGFINFFTESMLFHTNNSDT